MIKFSNYNRVKRYIKRRVFAFLYGGAFKEFGKKVSIVDPDIIEGEEFISLEDGVSFNSGVWMSALKTHKNNPSIMIKEGTTIGRFAHIIAIDEIVIENNVLIADKVYISDNIHSFNKIDTPIIHQEIEFKGQVSIGENSWIGENVSIIGAKIGKHCVIGANSVVNRSIPNHSVAVGIPAKVIKRYNFATKRWERQMQEESF